MNSILTINLVISSALIVAGSRLEATEGQNATIYFDIDEVEKATEVKITFKGVNEKQPSVIARFPWTSDDKPPAGVSLLVEEGRVSVMIHNVSISRNSGVYTARVFFGKKPYVVNATLLVIKPQSSSSPAPPHTSTPKPPSSSELKWLYVLIPVVVIIIIIIIVIIRRRRRRMCFQKKELENRCDACVSVHVNGCEEKAAAFLTDTQVS